MQQQGMRNAFKSWLDRKKGMTYTRYTKLPTEQKLTIQKEYAESRVKVQAPIVDADIHES